MNERDLLNAFTINYLNVYTVDCEENKCIIVKLNGYTFADIDKGPKELNYSDILKKYADSRLYQEDYDIFMNNLSCENLKKVFLTKEQYEFSYRVNDNDEIHYYSAHYIKISKLGEPLLLVAGFRNIDNIVVEQNKIKNDGLYKAYDTLSSLYLSMHRIDVPKNKFYEIKSTNHIKETVLSSEGMFDVSIYKVMKNLCNHKYLDNTLDMLDINKFDERLKNVSSFSFEFLGNFAGWCRARVIKEDTLPNGKLHHVILTIEVIDEARKKEDQLKLITQTDQLTGVLNRRYGEKFIIEKIKNKVSGLFMIVDCDHFKQINNNYGYDAGDLVIKSIAQSIAFVCKGEDILLRLGGDEFALFIPNLLSKDESIDLINSIVNKIESINIPLIESTKLFVSFGATFFDNKSSDTFNDIYKRAEKAIFDAKKTDGFSYTFE